MAASIVTDEERGTYLRSPRHPHNGYYAGDFRQEPPAASSLALYAPNPINAITFR